MRHPNQATLALHAGGDLAPFRRWLTARHLAHCATCREEVAGYNEMRDLLPELAELPEISWNRMAAEIKANIRLGLEAGECVRSVEMPRRRAPIASWRAAVAFGSVLALLGMPGVAAPGADGGARVGNFGPIHPRRNRVAGRQPAHAGVDERRCAEGDLYTGCAGFYGGSLHRSGDRFGNDRYGI